MTAIKRFALASFILAAAPALASAQVTTSTSAEQPFDNTNRTEIYPLGSAVSESAIDAISEVFKGNPNVTVSADQTAKTLVAVAPASAHPTIRKILEMLKRDGRSITVIPIVRVDGVAAKEVVTKLLGAETANGKDMSIDYDEAQRVFIAQGSQEQLMQLRKLLAQLDPELGAESRGNSGGRRSGGTPASGGRNRGRGQFGGNTRSGQAGLSGESGITSGFGGAGVSTFGTNTDGTTTVGTRTDGTTGFSRLGNPLGTSLGTTSAFTSKAPAADRPAILVTQPLPAGVRADWKEDLIIMDKLLREGIGRISSDSAMGIRVATVDNIQPMYLENFGALFSYGVSMPLAAGEAGAKSGQQAPPAPPSAWERARRELTGADLTWVTADATSASTRRVTNVKFDPAKLDELLAALLKTLPEAKNFRHLKSDGFVIVTITGVDDAGVPVRLTLKAQKTDIDDAAGGKLSPELFKKHVSWNVD